MTTPKQFDEILMRHLNGMVFEDALSLLLEEFEDGAVHVTWTNTKQSMSLNKIARIPQYRGLNAENVGPIEFWGGPPSERRHFKGSLMTMLCDRILYCWKVEGKLKDLVEVPPQVEYPIDA